MQGVAFHIAKHRYLLINTAIYCLGFIPALWYFYLGVSNQLGADPVKIFEQMLGLWALRFLILTLAISPLRDLSSWNFMRFRRAVGLLCFFYAVMHLAVYLLLDQAMNIMTLWDDVMKRPFITFGMAALLLLLPMALTSNNFSIRRMGRKWGQLHRLVYIAAILVVLHFSLSTKVLGLDHYFYIVLVILLLLYRVWRHVIKQRRTV